MQLPCLDDLAAYTCWHLTASLVLILAALAFDFPVPGDDDDGEGEP